MGWRDNLFSASFRGVPFKVKNTAIEVGRRSVVHEIPFNDTPYPEDFGKASGVYNVTGYVIQNVNNAFDYMKERDALIEACEKEGTGRLVHPFYGEIDVILSGRARFEESFDEGGLAKFTATFIEAGKIQVPSSFLSPKSGIESLADGLIKAANDFFVSVYDPSGPNFLTGTMGALGDVQGGMQAIQTSLYKFQATTVAEISGVLATVGAIRTSIGDIISFPTDLVDAVVNTFLAYRSLIPFLDTPRQSITAITAGLGLLDYGDNLDPIVEITPTREQQAANRSAIVAMYRVGAFAECINFSANIEYESYDQAYVIMQKLVDACDSLLSWLASVDNDILFDLVMESKSSFVSALLNLGASLPSVRYFTTPPSVYSSLVIAHRVYNDLFREAAIINRNKIAMMHPGFPNGNTELEVLSE